MKFDGQTHSMILTDGVINLSYSYLTFLMQTVDDQDNEEFVFDVEEYNYLINKKTALHDPELIQDFSTLKYVIENLEKLDIQLLEQLQYFFIEHDEHEDKKSARLSQSEQIR